VRSSSQHDTLLVYINNEAAIDSRHWKLSKSLASVPDDESHTDNPGETD
jgi:hypothetical protein